MATEQTSNIKRNVGANAPNNLAVQKKPNKNHITMSGEQKRNFAYYLMLLPGVIVLLINNYLPMIGVIMPFKNYVNSTGNFITSLFASQFVGFDNFKYLFASPDCISATINTVLYNLCFMGLDIVIPITLAICMSEMWNRAASNTYQTFLFLPYFISWTAVMYIAYAFFCNVGFIDRSIFSALGIHSIDFYSTPAMWPGILIFFHLWHYTGYNLIVYIAAISGINGEYYEAAALDGASKWQQIKYITLPMLKTTIVILTLLAVGRIFNGDFDLFFNVPKNVSQLWPTTQILDVFVYNEMSVLGDVGMSAAAGIYQAVVGCVVVFIANFAVSKVDPDSALF